MPKLAIYDKNENRGQKQNDSSSQKKAENSLETSSISIDESDLIELGIFESEKTEQPNNNETKTDSQINNQSSQAKFDELLSEAIDESLSLLGEAVKNTVYFQLENSFNISKKEIPKQIDEFSDIMRKIFGFGASRFEINLMKSLHSKINAKIKLEGYEWPLSKWVITDMTFSEYVYAVRKSYLEQRQGTK